MAYILPTLFEYQRPKETPIRVVIIYSVVFHIILLVGFPLLTKLFWNQKKFERPKTFQLVSTPLPPAPQRRVPVQKDARAQRMPQEEAKPTPRQLPDKQAVPKKKVAPKKAKEAARPIRENLDELASILDEIPAPAQVNAMGDFKYHWYLNIVQQRLEKYWNPNTENSELKVIVSFTINGDGSISHPSISQSSGNNMLDNLALQAVNLAAPFGKLPPGFAGNQLDLNCTLIPTRK